MVILLPGHRTERAFRQDKGGFAVTGVAECVFCFLSFPWRRGWGEVLPLQAGAWRVV